MPVILHRLAIREFVGTRRRYARRDPATESRFATEIGTALARINANPAAGAPFLGPYRWVPVKRFKYVLYYGPVDPTTQLVYAVAHTSRRPGYWMRRVNRP